VFASSIQLDQSSVDQLELTSLDLDQEDVAARRQDDEVDLPVPALTMMCGLPGDAVEDLIAVGQRLLQAIEHFELAVEARIVTNGVQHWRDLRHRLFMLLRTTTLIVPYDCHRSTAICATGTCAMTATHATTSERCIRVCNTHLCTLCNTGFGAVTARYGANSAR